MMKEQDLKQFETMPASTTCRLIAFDTVQIVHGVVRRTFFLLVSGVKPRATMQVELRPRIYVVQPEYWGIEVVACQTGIGLPHTAPYTVALDITHFLGKKGIEVIGATKSEKHK